MLKWLWFSASTKCILKQQFLMTIVKVSRFICHILSITFLFSSSVRHSQCVYLVLKVIPMKKVNTPIAVAISCWFWKKWTCRWILDIYGLTFSSTVQISIFCTHLIHWIHCHWKLDLLISEVFSQWPIFNLSIWNVFYQTSTFQSPFAPMPTI